MMLYKDMGEPGARLPALGLGTWQYRGGIEPLRAGIAMGASFIDTAESYGTEEIVGQAILGVRKDVFLATKVSPRHFKRADVFAAAEASLKRLNTDYIDLYQLHWPNYTIPIDETMGAMEQLVDTGRVRFIGVSNFYVHDLKNAQKALTRHKIVSNQVRYSLIDRSIESGLLEYCQQHNITIIAHSPLATGLARIRAKDPRRVIDKVAQAKLKNVAQVALRWCVSKEGIVAIPKANSIEHVKENCAACDFELSREELDLLDQSVRHRRRSSIGIRVRCIVRHGLQILGKEQ
jgi:diketogulonate reductase-like aldo/keto reductase